ncbi:MAG: hypothetical protein R3E01_34675 [Pirellulaceae bacterium]
MAIKQPHRKLAIVLFASLGALLPLARFAAAQQVVVQTPLVGSSNGFHENFGVGWNVAGFGGFHGNAVPPFGGFDPGGGANFGFRTGGLSLNFSAQQGSRRSMTSVVPSMVIPSGGGGFMFDGVQRPFVSGIIPVVGGMPIGAPTPYTNGPTLSPVAERLARLEFEQTPQVREIVSGSSTDAGSAHRRLGDATKSAAASVEAKPSSADLGASSLSAIRRQQSDDELLRRKEVEKLIRQADEAVQAGKKNLATMYLQMALRRSGPDQQYPVAARLREIHGDKTSTANRNADR